MTKDTRISLRLKPEEEEEFIKIAKECGCDPDTHGFWKDTIMEFMARTKDYNQDLKERVGALTTSKRRALLKLINASSVTEDLYKHRRHQ